MHCEGGGKVQGTSLRGGKMRGMVQGFRALVMALLCYGALEIVVFDWLIDINARLCVICEAGMCEAQQTTGAAGVVIGCEPLKRT